MQALALAIDDRARGPLLVNRTSGRMTAQNVQYLVAVRACDAAISVRFTSAATPLGDHDRLHAGVSLRDMSYVAPPCQLRHAHDFVGGNGTTPAPKRSCRWPGTAWPAPRSSKWPQACVIGPHHHAAIDPRRHQPPDPSPNRPGASRHHQLCRFGRGHPPSSLRSLRCGGPRSHSTAACGHPMTALPGGHADPTFE